MSSRSLSVRTIDERLRVVDQFTRRVTPANNNDAMPWTADSTSPITTNPTQAIVDKYITAE